MNLFTQFEGNTLGDLFTAYDKGIQFYLKYSDDDYRQVKKPEDLIKHIDMLHRKLTIDEVVAKFDTEIATPLFGEVDKTQCVYVNDKMFGINDYVALCKVILEWHEN